MCSLNVEPGRRVALQSSATNKPCELANTGGLQGWSRSDHDFTGARRHLSSEPRTLWSLMGRCRGAGPPDLLLFCCQTASQQLRRIKNPPSEVQTSSAKWFQAPCCCLASLTSDAQPRPRDLCPVLLHTPTRVQLRECVCGEGGRR